MSSPIRLVVLGADGRLGRAVSQAAFERGHDVVAVTRSGTLRRPIEGASVRAADALDAASLRAACDGATVIFNGLNPPYTAWERDALPMARNALAAAEATGALHLFPGNVYSLGRAMPPVVTPDTPHRPDTRKGRIRAAMEAMFDEGRERGVRTTVLRAGDFFGGPVPGSWFDLVVAARVDRAVVYPGPGDRTHAWAFVPDLARAFVMLAERADRDLPAVLAFEGHTLTGDKLHVALERAAGRGLRRKGFPWPAIRLAGLVHPMSREIAEMAFLWRTPHRLDDTALEATIGSVPHTPLGAALPQALADLKTMK